MLHSKAKLYYRLIGERQLEDGSSISTLISHNCVTDMFSGGEDLHGKYDLWRLEVLFLKQDKRFKSGFYSFKMLDMFVPKLGR